MIASHGDFPACPTQWADWWEVRLVIQCQRPLWQSRSPVTQAAETTERTLNIKHITNSPAFNENPPAMRQVAVEPKHSKARWSTEVSTVFLIAFHFLTALVIWWPKRSRVTWRKTTVLRQLNYRSLKLRKCDRNFVEIWMAEICVDMPILKFVSTYILCYIYWGKLKWPKKNISFQFINHTVNS